MVLPGHEIHELIAGASQLATSTLAAAVWQGILLAGAAAIGLRLLPETPAPVRFAIWFGVFLLVGGLPFATVWLTHAGPVLTAGAPSHAWLTLDTRWCFWVAVLWAAASLVRAIALIVAGFHVRALWKRAQPIALELPELERKAQVCVSDEVDRPTVIGFLAPKIVIPTWLIAKLTPEELQQVVLHEAGHLSRRDDWLNLLQKLALVIFPLNPALAWVERRLCFERELACDEHVLAATKAPKAYAECLATLADYRLQRRGLVRGLALALGALGRESELTKRVVRILDGGARMKKTHARLVFGGSMLTLVFAASAMERSPQLVGFAQQGTENREQGTGISAEHSIAATAAFRAVAVRASVAPAQEWKTVGDATPHVARRVTQRSEATGGSALTSAAKAANLAKAAYGTAEAVPLSKTDVVARKTNAVAMQRTNTEVLRSAQDDKLGIDDASMGNEPEVIQTVATTRQVTADGRVLVTRMVTVSAYNVSSATPPVEQTQPISDASGAAPQRQSTPARQQMVHGYAAVPVRGGWLVFQL